MNFIDTLKSVELVLASGDVPLVVGESGIGKTALAKKLSEKNGWSFFVNVKKYDGKMAKLYHKTIQKNQNKNMLNKIWNKLNNIKINDGGLDCEVSKM